MHDIPPAPNEDFMPPIAGLTYRVLFFYTPYRSAEEFWKNECKHWAKLRDKFVGPGPAVTAAVKDLVVPTDTPDQKLRKIYAAVMKLENTSYTREHSNVEEKAQGFKEVRNTDDIWERKRGSNDQIADLFVAMARAAGMKAYVGRVTSRDRVIFLQAYLSLSQLDDDIAIVNLDGKEQFFDPGSRFCPYQHLEWKHTWTGGIRQSDSGGEIFQTPGEPYTFSRTSRVADLTMDEKGAVTGTIKMTYTGAPASAMAAALRCKAIPKVSTANCAPASNDSCPAASNSKSPPSTSSKTTSSRSSRTSKSKEPSAPQPANASSFPEISSRPTLSRPSPTRSATSPSTFSIRTQCWMRFALNFRRRSPSSRFLQPKKPTTKNLRPTACRPSPRQPASPSAATISSERSSISPPSTRISVPSTRRWKPRTRNPSSSPPHPHPPNQRQQGTDTK